MNDNLYLLPNLHYVSNPINIDVPTQAMRGFFKGWLKNVDFSLFESRDIQRAGPMVPQDP